MTGDCTLRARSQWANNDQQTQKQRVRSRQDCSRSYWKYPASCDSNISVHLTVGKAAVAFVWASVPWPIGVNLSFSRTLCPGQKPPAGARATVLINGPEAPGNRGGFVPGRYQACLQGNLLPSTSRQEPAAAHRCMQGRQPCRWETGRRQHFPPLNPPRSWQFGETHAGSPRFVYQCHNVPEKNPLFGKMLWPNHFLPF